MQSEAGQEGQETETAPQGGEGSGGRRPSEWEERWMEEEQLPLGGGSSSSKKTKIKVYDKWWRSDAVS